MTKYIIKNCLSYENSVCDNQDMFCQDCTDCVMKQIVELCRYYKKHSDCGRDCPSFGRFLDKLLNKLNIQEIE